jgi:hypothetical protein
LKDFPFRRQRISTVALVLGNNCYASNYTTSHFWVIILVNNGICFLHGLSIAIMRNSVSCAVHAEKLLSGKFYWTAVSCEWHRDVQSIMSLLKKAEAVRQNCYG